MFERGIGMKNVFHVDELKKWELTLGNAKNLLSYCQDMAVECEIEIVANAEAVTALTRAEAARLGLDRPMETLTAMGVVIAACGNALEGNDIPAEALCPWVTVVPAGVAELSLKQAEGFAYIKP